MQAEVLRKYADTVAERCAAARGGHTKYFTSKWIKRVGVTLSHVWCAQNNNLPILWILWHEILLVENHILLVLYILTKNI